MKKLIYLFILGIGFTSCSVESLDSTENLLTADVQAKLKATNTSSMVFLPNVCAGEETIITINFEQRVSPQGKNLPTNVKVELKNNDGSWSEIYKANLNNVISISFNYTFAEEKTYTLRYDAEQGGWNQNQDLVVKNCCEESFSYVDNSNGTYTFKYTAGEDMEAAEVVFTFAQGSYVNGLSADFARNGNNGQTYDAVMDLKKCDVLEYTVTLTPKCSGNSASSNVWTDFKVNDVSKKANEEDKFVASCN